MPSLLQQLIDTWERTQVELQGSYSPHRLLALAQFTRETSWLRVITILVATPLPCLIVTVLVDSLPLADPSDGLQVNKLFFVRAFYTYLVITFGATNQFRFSVPELPYPIWKAILNTIVVSALSTAIMYALDVAIGFPLPFSLLTTTPPWVTLIAITLAIEWARKIPVTPGSGEMLINTIKLWMCQVLMVCVYPPYYYIFTTLSKTGQTMFSMLLPGIKLTLRNIFARTIVHLSDDVPDVIAFNIEIFNSLFASYCIQNSPSIGTTLTVTGALLIQLVLSLRDVHIAAQETERLGRQLAHDRLSQNPDYAVPKSSVGGHILTALEHAEVLLLEQHSILLQGTSRTSSLKLQVKPAHNSGTRESRTGINTMRNDNTCMEPLAAMPQLSETRIQPAPTKNQLTEDPKNVSTTSIRYILAVQKLLYLTEFLVLINYVGVFIPLIFTSYMGIMYRLPNRMYYAQLADLTEEDLYQALENIMFNGLLKFIALIMLCSVLHCKLRFSALHQLAFVLANQWPSIQTKTIFWVYYIVQGSLQHNGYDYTFAFEWIQNNSSTSNSRSSTNT